MFKLIHNSLSTFWPGNIHQNPKTECPSKKQHSKCTVHAWSVVLDSVQPHELKPMRLLWSCDFLGKITGLGCHFLLQGIFPIQQSNPCLLHCRWNIYHELPGKSTVNALPTIWRVLENFYILWITNATRLSFESTKHIHMMINLRQYIK